MGVYEVIYGYLISDMLGFEWEFIVFNQLIYLKVEFEIVFLMGEDFCGINLIEEDVLKVVKYVVLVFEIIDSCYLDFKFIFFDVVVDNCLFLCFIVGSNWIKFD